MTTVAAYGLKLATESTEYLERKGSTCDNKLCSDKPRHPGCRAFISMCALVVRADIRYDFTECNYANWFP